MHDIRWIRDNADAFDRALARRHLSYDDCRRFSSESLIKLDDDRRSIIVELEKCQQQRNEISAEIGKAKRAGVQNAETALRDNLILLRTKIQKLEEIRSAIENDLAKLLIEIPNIPFDPPEVPDGKDASENQEYHHFGMKPEHAFSPKEHFDLGESLGQMDFETAARLSGARFVVLKKGLARLERALGQFMLDVHTSEPHNYTEVAPPLLVRDEVMFGTAQLPKFHDDQFAAFPEPVLRSKFLQDLQTDRDHVLGVAERFGLEQAKALKIADVRLAPDPGRFWLIPTAEVPLTNLVRESIVDEAQLPMRYTACTPCFRAEAGAAGKDTRGMIRQHQFTKVELVSITTPEQSKDEHERMLACAEEVLKKLDLHYRVMTLCAGDMGFASQKTYDIEVWLPGQNMYREISSCSICGDFQARRMNARYRPRGLKGGAVYNQALIGRFAYNQPPNTPLPLRHVHTLNGSGVAVGRALIAVMETYQQADGSIAVPEALQSYMGGMKTIEK